MLNTGSNIHVYNSSNAPIEEFASLTGSFGVTVSDASGDVYVSEKSGGEPKYHV